MAHLTTANYGWVKADVEGSNGAWGTILNTIFDAIDTALKAVSAVADAALAKAGGTMTGNLALLTTNVARVDKGSISGAQAFDTATAQYFTLTVGGALSPSFTGATAGTVAQAIILRITNGGAFVITWPASVKWASGTAPTLTAAGVDLVGLISDDNGTTWRGLVLGKDLR